MESDDSNPLHYEDWQGDCTLWQHAVCGSAAGLTGHLFLFPLDTLKTRLQCGWCKPRGLARSPLSGAAAERGRGVCTLSPPQSQLYRNLFRGCNVMAVGCVPAHVFYFSVYEMLKKISNVPLAGAFATLCHDVVLTPADVIKQRLQLGSYRGSLDCLQQVLRKEGLTSLYRSLSVTLFMNVPYHAILVSVNEFLMRTHPGGKDNCGTATYFVYAGIGGAAAGTMTNPIDVVKTRLQTQECHLSKEGACERFYTNSIDAARAVYRQHGFRGFWRGAVTRMLISIPAAAISWGTYATLKNAFRRCNNG